MTSDICFLSAREMAARIRSRELSAREVLEAHLSRIERVNPQVNAIVTLVADRARAQAAAADEAQARGEAIGPLHGVPILHKDLTDTARCAFCERSEVVEHWRLPLVCDHNEFFICEVLGR